MKVNLCEGCIEMLEEYYPYLVPKEELDIRTVNVLDCDNMFMDVDYGPEEENDEDPLSLEEMLDILCVEDGDEEEFLSRIKDLFFSFIEEKEKERGFKNNVGEKL